jgi:hypothetical protein
VAAAREQHTHAAVSIRGRGIARGGLGDSKDHDANEGR